MSKDYNQFISNLHASQPSRSQKPIRRLPGSRKCRAFSDHLKRIQRLNTQLYSLQLQSVAVRKLCEVRSEDSEVPGFVVLNRIFQVLSEIKINGETLVLRLDQEVMLAHMICATLPFLFGDDLEPNLQFLLRKLRVKVLNEYLLVIAPRRAGKTTVLAAFVSAILIAVPIVSIVVFSVSQRSSELFYTEVVKFLRGHDQGERLYQCKIKATIDHLKLVDPSNPSFIKEFKAFPDSPKVCYLFIYISCENIFEEEEERKGSKIALVIKV